MSKHFSLYWKPTTADENLARGGLLIHAASNQFGPIKIGDTVWIFTVRNGELFLLGRVQAAQITDQEGAARVLGTQDIWLADLHIIADAATSHEINDISISQLASRLRFHTRHGEAGLNVVGGRVNPQQLQRMRQLTSGSVSLLEEALFAGAGSCAKAKAEPGAPLAGAAPKHESVQAADIKQEIIESLRRLQSAGKKSFDLVKPEYRDLDRSEVDLNGLCYVLSECLYHLYPTLLTPYRISWGDGTTHWFLRDSNGEILDAIVENGEKCCEDEDYDRAHRRPFFTKQPSKRATKLFARAGMTIPRK